MIDSALSAVLFLINCRIGSFKAFAKIFTPNYSLGSVRFGKPSSSSLDA
jgi:hypothetical protein